MKNAILACLCCLLSWQSHLHGAHLLVKQARDKVPEITKSKLLASDMRLEKGALYNDYMLYSAAIEELDKAIQLNPSNREAYIERAFAHFELQQFKKAMRDYYSAEKFNSVSAPYIAKFLIFYPQLYEAEHSCGIGSPKDTYDYSQGLSKGAKNGMMEGAASFIPSTLQTLTGIGQGLWALGYHPYDTCQEYYETILTVFHHTCSQSIDQTLIDFVPELKELQDNWHVLSPHEKGRYQGFIIGKYGFEVLSGRGLSRGIQCIRKLRRASTLQTLKACAKSTENNTLILAEAAKRVVLRQELKKSGSLKIHQGKQNKHLRNHPHYEKGKSILEHKDPQKLLDEHAFTGVKDIHCVEGIGMYGYKEIVNFKEPIGLYINSEKNLEIPTTWGKIHYAKNGAHIVPHLPPEHIK